MTKTILHLLWLCALSGCNDRPMSPAYTGYIEADIVYASVPAAGLITDMAVIRGQAVSQGEKLFSLASAAELAQVEELASRLAGARARLSNASEGRRPEELAVLAAQQRQADADLQNATRALARQEQLAREHFVSSQAVDAARSQQEIAHERLKEFQAQMKVARLAARPGEIAAASAEVAAAARQLEQARIHLAERTGFAAIDGTVSDVYYRAGEVLTAGAPVLALLPQGARKVRFFVPVEALSTLTRGMPLRLHIGDPQREASARVGYIAPTPEYAPPYIFSRSARSKLVVMVEATIAPSDADRLQPGQPVDVVVQQ